MSEDLTPEDSPPSAWELATQASELLDRRRFGQARALLSQALQQHPGDTGLLFELARADYLQDDLSSARSMLAELLRLAPGDINGRWLMFLVEMEDDHLPAAEALVLELLRESPENAQFYAGYCRLMLRALNFDKARALADEALRRAPNAEDALRARAMCDLVDMRGSTDSAALAQLVASDPHDAHTLRLVVVALVQARRGREAHKLARELLRHQPDDPHLLSLVKALRVDNHWSLLPLWPMQRYGWYGSIALWAGVIVLLQVLRRNAPGSVGVVSTIVLVYVAYSWLWPPLLRRWLNRD